jgi:membrane protein DedA with SNARE-associated domain
MMRRYRLWLAWILGPLTVALICLTVLAAVFDFTSWSPLLAAAIVCAVAGTVLFALGPRVARQQERESRARQSQSGR